MKFNGQVYSFKLVSLFFKLIRCLLTGYKSLCFYNLNYKVYWKTEIRILFASIYIASKIVI